MPSLLYIFVSGDRSVLHKICDLQDEFKLLGPPDHACCSQRGLNKSRGFLAFDCSGRAMAGSFANTTDDRMEHRV